MKRNFDIDALRTIVVGVELGSFTRAASELGRSQSAISMHIKKLEERTGKQLFTRQGRGLVPTEAGVQLLNYARKILALNDEAAVALDLDEAESNIKLGLPQDFFDVILPDTISAFSSRNENVHVDVRAGRNYALEEEVNAGRLDVAIAFFPSGSRGYGELLLELPTYWFGSNQHKYPMRENRASLVLFDHPCLFRSNMLKSMEDNNWTWRVALTTPSLTGVWSAVHTQQGITSRTRYLLPEGIEDVRKEHGLPPTNPIEVRLLVSQKASPAALALAETLKEITLNELEPLALQTS